MQQKSHAIVRLAVHLEREHQIFFRAGHEREALRNTMRMTTLTAWFQLNRTDPDAREIFYYRIPEEYTFISNRNGKHWKKRERHTKTIGRMYSVNPADMERYCLRLLLVYTPGATSYAFLRTVNGQVFETFREACIARELMEHDDEWILCMAEASEAQMPHQLRHLFCIILMWCHATDPHTLFSQYIASMSEDHQNSIRRVMNNDI